MKKALMLALSLLNITAMAATKPCPPCQDQPCPPPRHVSPSKPPAKPCPCHDNSCAKHQPPKNPQPCPCANPSNYPPNPPGSMPLKDDEEPRTPQRVPVPHEPENGFYNGIYNGFYRNNNPPPVTYTRVPTHSVSLGTLIGQDLYLDTKCAHALCIVNKDGTYSLTVYGQVIANHSAFGGAYNSGAFGQETQLESARLGLTGTLDENWGYRVELTNSAGDELDNVFVRRGYITYTVPTHNDIYLLFTGGKQGPQYGQDNMHDSNNTYGTSFAMISQAFSAPTATGLSALLYWPLYGDSGFNAYAGVYHVGTVERTSDEFPQPFQEETSLIDARIGWAIYENDEEAELIYASGSFEHLGRTDRAFIMGRIVVDAGVCGTLQEGAPPVTSGFFGIPALFNEGIEIDNTTGFDFALTGQYGPFSIIGEYSQLELTVAGNSPGEPDNVLFPGGVSPTLGFESKPRFYGYLVEGGIVLTGEHREFDKHNGYLLGVTPKCKYGALELIARYERIYLLSEAGLQNNGADNAPTPINIGTNAHTITVGFNWYLTKHLYFALDGTYLRVRGPDASRPSGIGGCIEAGYFF